MHQAAQEEDEAAKMPTPPAVVPPEQEEELPAVPTVSCQASANYSTFVRADDCA